MQGRFKMEYRLFTIVRYNYNYRDYNKDGTLLEIRMGYRKMYSIGKITVSKEPVWPMTENR